MCRGILGEWLCSELSDDILIVFILAAINQILLTDFFILQISSLLLCILCNGLICQSNPKLTAELTMVVIMFML